MKAVEPTPIFETKDAAAQRTIDGFANFVARLGVGPQGSPQQPQNVLTHGHYNFDLITRNRVQLEAAYRGSWIVGRVIDCRADDMTRAGIQITTNEDPERIDEIQREIKRLKIWNSTRAAIKWGDLYGGSLAVVQIEGQSLETPLDPETISEGQFKGLVVYDRWQVYPVLDKLINSGPDLGLPEFYDIVLGANLNNPSEQPGGQITDSPTQRVRVHHTRALRMIGIELPFWQAITEMMWGESKLERLWDRLIAFDDATLAAGNLINRAQLRVVQVESLREIIGAGGKALENLVAQFEHMRMLQQNEGITLLDKTDTFESVSYTFAGIPETLIQFGQQVSGAAETPLVILFGQTPVGLNSSADGDIRAYYDRVNAKQEADLRNFFEVVLKIIWRSLTGKPAPKDMAFTFVPLWQMSATDKATVAKTNTDTILEAHESGLVDSATAMKELKQNSAETGLFTHITDEAVEEAENEEPPEPEATTSEGEVGNPGAGPADPAKKTGKQAKGPEMSEKTQLTGQKTEKKTGDSAWLKIKRWLTRDRGVEATIKEFEKGTLKSSSGKKVTSKKQALAIGYSEQGEDTAVSDAQKIKDWLSKQ